MPHTLLLVDDSTAIQRVVALMLAEESVAVVSASDADEAMDAIRQSPPDVLLVDTDMPGRSGYDLVEEVRRDPSLRRLPVLLLAGAFEPVDRARAAQVGADGILTKPFEPGLLVARVRELLAGGRPSAPPVPPEAIAVAERAAPPPDVDALMPAPKVSPEVDLYFEQLDEAFAALAQSPRMSVPLVDEPAPASPPDAADALPVEASETPTPPAPVLAPAPVPAPPPALPAAAAAAGAPVGLTDAFAALLAAEQAGTDAPAFFALPVQPVSVAVDTNDLAEQVARRVLERLTDKLVRETVADLVSGTAERLVREEIERIKRNIT